VTKRLERSAADAARLERFQAGGPFWTEEKWEAPKLSRDCPDRGPLSAACRFSEPCGANPHLGLLRSGHDIGVARSFVGLDLLPKIKSQSGAFNLGLVREA
jgi:hypothetical protein